MKTKFIANVGTKGSYAFGNRVRLVTSRAVVVEARIQLHYFGADNSISEFKLNKKKSNNNIKILTE